MKKRKHWSLVVFILLLTLITGCKVAPQEPVQEKPKTVETDEVKQDKANANNSLAENETIEDIQLFNVKIAEIQGIVERTDAGLAAALGRLGLQESNLHSENLQVQLDEGLIFTWIKMSGTVQIPSGRNLEEVVNTLSAAVKSAGSQLLFSRTTAGVKTVVFGFIIDGLEIVTHQYNLTQVTAALPHSEPIEIKAKLAFVIDDLGYTWPEFNRMMTIPVPMTFAVLPYLPESVKQAQIVWQKGYDLILHLPMEPSTPNNPGEGAIYTVMSDDVIKETITRNLAALPQGLIGVNNHMGSKATADGRVVRVVLQLLKERKMFFIDSRTTIDSVVAPVAKDVGIAYAENRIFIDNVDELEPIKVQIRKAAKIALAEGEAIAIGHVRNYTAKAILEMLDELHAMGIKIVFVKELLHK